MVANLGYQLLGNIVSEKKLFFFHWEPNIYWLLGYVKPL